MAVVEATGGSGGAAELAGLLRAGRFTEAEARLRERLARRPDDAQDWNNLANVLGELGRPAEAEAAFRRAIAIRPDFAAAHYNLGLQLQAERRLEAAEAAYAAALAVRPDLAQAHNNRGAALRDMGRLEEAVAAFDKALRLRPDYADAQFNQALCRLALGDYARGWAQYEWRWRIHQASLARAWPGSAWLGRQPVAGRTLVLHAEQGFGDTLQFCRYAPMAAALGARVVLQVQPGLERLLARLEGVSQVLVQPVRPSSVDLHTPMMSLPLAFGTRLETTPAEVPYLSAEPMAAARWSRRLVGERGLRVGLVWAGAARPDQPVAAGVDRRRSLPLSAFAPLSALQGVRFFSLQKGPAAAQLADAERSKWAGPAVEDFTAELGDFADTAALVANLDLVVTCDTAVAHLAGGMGKPVWILSRFDGCWRWLLDRDDSPWYPTARLFRQRTRGDWDEVVGRVAAALAELIGQGGGG